MGVMVILEDVDKSVRFVYIIVIHKYICLASSRSLKGAMTFKKELPGYKGLIWSVSRAPSNGDPDDDSPMWSLRHVFLNRIS